MPRPRGDIEPRVLKAARERFLNEGVDGASLRGIASDAGTSIGMVYYYFPSKDALFLAVVEEVYEVLLRDLEAAIQPDVPVEQRVLRVLLRAARLSADELEVMRLVAREALSSSARLETLIARFQRGHIPLLARLVADGVAARIFAPELHPMVILFSLLGVGVVPQLIRRVLDDRLPFAGAPAGEQLANELAGVLFNGVGRPGAAGR